MPECTGRGPDPRVCLLGATQTRTPLRIGRLSARPSDLVPSPGHRRLRRSVRGRGGHMARDRRLRVRPFGRRGSGTHRPLALGRSAHRSPLRLPTDIGGSAGFLLHAYGNTGIRWRRERGAGGYDRLPHRRGGLGPGGPRSHQGMPRARARHEDHGLRALRGRPVVTRRTDRLRATGR